MLLHVFDSEDAVETRVIYLVLTIILVIFNIACYFFPMHVASWLQLLVSCCASTAAGSSSEQQPLMKAKEGRHINTDLETPSSADSQLSLQALDAHS
jgi:hypothetical protein